VAEGRVSISGSFGLFHSEQSDIILSFHSFFHNKKGAKNNKEARGGDAVLLDHLIVVSICPSIPYIQHPSAGYIFLLDPIMK
jgi:hypothetical protein